MAAAFQHHAGAAQHHLGGIFLGLGAGQAGGHAAIGQCLDKLVHPGRAAAGNCAGGIDQRLRHFVQPPGGLHGGQPFLQLGRLHVVAAVLDHTGAQRYGGVGHHADDGVTAARHVADLLHRKPRRHADQHKGAAFGPGLQRGGQLVQHVSHHLGFDPQKNKIADTGDLLVGATGTAQIAGQGLRFGWCAVGQQHIPGACTLADRTGHCAAHIAAADKTVFHGDPPRIL